MAFFIYLYILLRFIVNYALKLPYFVYSQSDDEENSEEDEYSNDSDADSDGNYKKKTEVVIKLNDDTSEYDSEIDGSRESKENKHKTVPELSEDINNLKKEREIIDQAIQDRKDGVNPRDSKALKQLQDDNSNILGKCDNADELINKVSKKNSINIENKLDTLEKLQIAQEDFYKTVNDPIDRLAIPDNQRSKRSRKNTDESEENSSSKRYKSDSAVGNQDSKSTNTNSNTSISTNTNPSEISPSNLPYNQENSPSKTSSNSNPLGDIPSNQDNTSRNTKYPEGESPIDYVLEKQACEMPDIPDSDGGGD
jgi:hypothetical protein